MNRNRSLLTILMVVGLVAVLAGIASAQVSTWAVCNGFNVIRPNNTTIWIPGEYNPGDYPLDVPGGAGLPFTEARINTWRYATTLVKYNNEGCTIRDDAGCTEIFNEGSAVLRLDLRSHGTNVQFRAITLTLLGSPDFDPREDLLPIFPDSASYMFFGRTRDSVGHYLEAVDTLTGVEFFEEAGINNSRSTEPWRKNRFDSDDVRAAVEALDTAYWQDMNLNAAHDAGIDSVDYASPTWTEVTDAQIQALTAIPGLNTAARPLNWRWWRATFVLRQSIDISNDSDMLTAGLQFKRIWIALRPSGCHQCRDNSALPAPANRPGTPNTIEGLSNADSFYVMILRPSDVRVYDYSVPMTPQVILPTNKIRVLPDLDIWNASNDPDWDGEADLYGADPSHARWAVAEEIYGQDIDKPVISNKVPYNTVCTNGPLSGVGQENDSSIYTADETQVISFSAKDMGACVDSVKVTIKYMNWVANQFPNYRTNTLTASQDSAIIIFHNPRTDAVNGDPWQVTDYFNNGFAYGWEWKFNNTVYTAPTVAPWTQTQAEAAVYSPCVDDRYDGEIVVRVDTLSLCPLVTRDITAHMGEIYPWEFADTFYVRVGYTAPTNDLLNFIDGARVHVNIWAWDRTNRLNLPNRGGSNVAQDSIRFIVDLSGPNAELECPRNDVFMDDSTREYRHWTRTPADPMRRTDIFEGEERYWVFLSDSLPNLTFHLYDDYNRPTGTGSGAINYNAGILNYGVHDEENHGTTYQVGAGNGGAKGGGGINIRQMDLVLRHVPCTGEPYEKHVFSDSSTDAANDMAGYPMDGIYWTEEDSGWGGRLTVDLDEQYHRTSTTRDTLWALRDGEIVYLIMRSLYDDMDWGQADNNFDYSIPITEQAPILYSDDYYRDCIGDPNYGTRHRHYNDPSFGFYVGDNHVVLDAQILAAACPAAPNDRFYTNYTDAVEDTMGIIRVDLTGPKFDAATLYPPPSWITSDSFQVVTVDIYDP